MLRCSKARQQAVLQLERQSSQGEGRFVRCDGSCENLAITHVVRRKATTRVHVLVSATRPGAQPLQTLGRSPVSRQVLFPIGLAIIADH